MLNREHKRSAFTMVELLVVIAIIAILASATAGAVIKYLSVQRSSNTEMTIRKTYARLMAHWAAAIDTAKIEFSNDVNAQLMLQSAFGSDQSLQKVIYIKLRLAEEFPMTMAEALTPPGGLPAKSAFQKLPAGLAGQPFESSALLLTAIRQGRKGMTSTADDFGSSIRKFTVGSNTFDAIVDGWGNPIQFYRWPTGCTELDGLCPVDTTSAGNPVRDPQDPDGRLLSLTNGSKQQFLFEGWCHPLRKPAGSVTNYAYYTFPVIASAGQDGKLGLNADMSSDGSNNDFDNLYSFRLIRPGSKGD